MDYACPHCHELMRTDPASGQPPPMCPRCGGDISIGTAPARAPEEPAPASAARTAAGTPATRSLATFLQSTSSEGAASVDRLPRVDADTDETSAQAPGVQAVEPTLEDDEVPGAEDGADSGPRLSTSESDAPAVAGPEHGRAAAQDLSQGSAARGLTSTTDQAPGVRDDALAPAAHAVPASTTKHETSATPSFTQPARDRALPAHTARWQWAALATLALALFLQVVLADRARLAADAQWRPLLTSLCGVFGCALPVWHEPDAFTMLSRDVRPAPGSSGALLVQATFRNDARWSQSWPVIRLSLSDADGRTVGARAFVASEYLDAATTQTALAPGQSAQIMLQVREPETSVVAFSFDFD